jgi:hypothetical protein
VRELAARVLEFNASVNEAWDCEESLGVSLRNEVGAVLMLIVPKEVPVEFPPVSSGDIESFVFNDDILSANLSAGL